MTKTPKSAQPKRERVNDPRYFLVFIKTIAVLFCFGFLFFGGVFGISHTLKAEASESSWPQDLSTWKYRKKIHIDGSTAGDQSNYVMKLNTHYGDQRGHMPDTTNSNYENFIRNIKDDVYLNGKSQTDFNDLRFTTSDGTEISAWKANSGNYEYVYDDNGVSSEASMGVRGNDKFIVTDTTNFTTNCFSEGDIIASFPGSYSQNAIYLSKDNGENWVKIANMQNTGGNYAGEMMFLDSQGTFYTAESRTGKSEIYSHTCNYIGGTYVINANLELNLLDEGGVTISGGTYKIFNWAEDSLGNIFFGRYNNPSGHSDGLLHPAIYKKPRGGSFTLSYSRVNNPTTTGWHIHGISIDPTNQNIYAFVDGDYPLKSTDHGNSWSEIGGSSGIAALSMNGNTMVFGPDKDHDGNSDYRLFGAENGNAKDINILKTTDDVNFEVVLVGKDFLRNLVRVESTNTIYALGTTSYDTNAYPQILMSNDDGVTWETIYISDFEERQGNTGSWGVYTISNVGSPAGDDKQILTSGGYVEYPGARLYVEGEHYQGTFYLKMPSIPEAGTDIYVYYGNSDASSSGYSANDVFGGNKANIVQDGLAGWWKFDDYSGTNVPDQSGNGNSAVLGNTAGSGSYSIEENDLTKITQRQQAVNNPGTISSGSAKHLSLTRGADDTKGGYATISVPPDDGRSGNMGPNQLNLTTNFTLVAWIKGESITTSVETIIAKGLSGAVQYELGLDSNGLLFFESGRRDDIGNEVAIIVYSESIFTTSRKLTQLVGVTVSGLINPGETYSDYGSACVDNGHDHVCQYVTFWVDGRKINTRLLGHHIVNVLAGSSAGYSNSPVRIGAEVLRNAANTYYTFNGEIDEVRIYNKMLSQTEFVSLFEMRPVAGTYPGGESVFDAETKVDSENTRSEKTVSQSTLFKNVTNTIDATNSLITYNSEPNVSDEVNMTITPNTGSIETVITTWNTLGDYLKTWTESGTDTTSATHTIGDLLPNTYYSFKLDSTASTTAITNNTQCANGICLSDPDGVISFTYVGGYSTHTFALEKDVTGPSVFTLSSPTNNSSVSNRPALSWNATSDSESGLNKYQLYIDGVLDRDNISSSANSSDPINDLSCGNHTWYIRAIDKTGNTTDSNIFNVSYLCGSVSSYQPTSCSSIVYDDWQKTCVNGWQYRNIKSQNPSGCSLTSAQENDRKRQCGSTAPATETTPITSSIPTAPTKTASEPNVNITLDQMQNDANIITTGDVNQLVAEVGAKRDLATESVYSRTIVEKIVKDTGVSDQTRNTITNFITYGTSTTQPLGAGERAGVVNSFKSTFGKLPTTEKDWNDVIKIANGRWPGQIDKKTEKNAEAAFKKIYTRNPDMANAHDNVAVTIISYGLRPSSRNLESEKKGIIYFKNIYGYAPKSATAWDIVRAIAYSGATR